MIKNAFLIGLGLLLLVVGAIGLFLPVWPTTPFVLLSAACLSVSPRLRGKIMKVSFFREHIENYRNRRGLSRKTVIISLGYLWAMLLLSMFLISRLWLTCLLCAIGFTVTTHILWMSRRKSEA